MLNKLPFLYLVWTTCNPIPVSHNRLVFSWIFLSSLRIGKHSNHSYLGHRKLKRYSTTRNTQRKETVISAGHYRSVEGPCWLKNEAVRVIDYYKIMDTFFTSEAQQFPPSAVLQQDRASLHIFRALRSILYELLSNSWIGRHGLTGWLGKPPD